MKTAAAYGFAFVVLWTSLASAQHGEAILSERNTEAPFCYLPGGVRSWPVLTRRLEPGETLSLTARRNDETIVSGPTLEVGGLTVSVSEDGRLIVDARAGGRDADGMSFELVVALQRSGQTVQSQTLAVRPAPPARPISYVVDLVDDLINIFWDPKAGRFRPVTKDGFDQYFRRVQAHGVTRLIVWHSPFPYFTNPADHDSEHWQRYERQARAIIDSLELEQSIPKSESLPSWLWLRYLLEMRLNPAAGEMFAQSAVEHGIALTASFRPFESALTKYYEVPAFDQNAEYLWGFLPLAMPIVNYQPERVCFAHYRVILDGLGRPELGQVGTIELPGVKDVDALVKQYGPTGGFELRASRFPPIAADSFVLVRQPGGRFELKRFGEIRELAAAKRQAITGFRLELGADGEARLSGVIVPDESRFVILTHTAAATDPAADSLALDKEVPVRLRAQAGNRLNRETIYWVLDESTPAGRESRIAGIAPDGEYRAVFQAATSSIKSLLAAPQRVKLAGNAVVIDLGDRFSVEIVDFQQVTARQMAVGQLKTLLGLRSAAAGNASSEIASRPVYDEIFINTRSHVDLAPTVADGADGQLLIADYYRTGHYYRHHLGLDKAYAPRSVADDARLRAAAQTPETAEQITTWQEGEWRDSCQSSDCQHVWRLARNVAVAEGVTRLLQDLEQEFPGVHIRAVIPPRAEAVERIQKGLETMPSPGGGMYGRDYYHRLWCSNNHSPATGEGMALVDLAGTKVEPVFLGSGGYLPDAAPFELFVREQIADLADNRGSQFRGPRSYFYEGQFTLRAADLADAQQGRERLICHLLSQRNDIREVLLYEAADWLYFLPLSDPDLSGHEFIERCVGEAR